MNTIEEKFSNSIIYNKEIDYITNQLQEILEILLENGKFTKNITTFLIGQNFWDIYPNGEITTLFDIGSSINDILERIPKNIIEGYTLSIQTYKDIDGEKIIESYNEYVDSLNDFLYDMTNKILKLSITNCLKYKEDVFYLTERWNNIIKNRKINQENVLDKTKTLKLKKLELDATNYLIKLTNVIIQLENI